MAPGGSFPSTARRIAASLLLSLRTIWNDRFAVLLIRSLISSTFFAPGTCKRIRSSPSRAKVISVVPCGSIRFLRTSIDWAMVRAWMLSIFASVIATLNPFSPSCSTWVVLSCERLVGSTETDSFLKSSIALGISSAFRRRPTTASPSSLTRINSVLSRSASRNSCRTDSLSLSRACAKTLVRSTSSNICAPPCKSRPRLRVR